ncbi:MAG: ABC transporter permease [Candidatus Brocadiia bacterium]
MIRRLTALFSFELSKALRWKFTYISFAMAAVGCVLASILPEYLHHFKDAEINGYTLTAIVAHYAVFPIGALLTTVFAALVVGQEYSCRTLPTLMSGPVRRLEVAAAKFVLVAAYDLALVVFIYSFSMVMTAFVNGYEKVVIDTSTSITLGQVWPMYVAGAIFSTIPLIAASAAVMAITVIAENPGTAIGVSIGGALLLFLLGFSTFPDYLLVTSYFGTATTMLLDMGEQIDVAWFPDMIEMLLVSAAYVAVSLGVYGFVFQRKDAV